MESEELNSNLARVGVLAISDREEIIDAVGHSAWRSSGGEEVELALPPAQFTLLRLLTLPRGRVDEVASVLRDWSDAPNPSYRCHLILTVGGDTFAPGDIVPDATREVIDRDAPGLAEWLRRAAIDLADGSIDAVCASAMSRATAGLRKSTLIVNLPSCFDSVTESVNVLLPVLPSLLEALADN
jgi:molybdopterin biosynthesis enzyme MoaB